MSYDYDNYNSYSQPSGLQETLEYYWDKAFSDDTKPMGRDLIDRLKFALPTFMIGGALGGALAGHISQLSGMVAAGISLGSMFILANTATNMACKILGIEIASDSKERTIKTIVDQALAALITFTLCYFSATPITLHSLAVLVPCVAWGAMMTFIGSHVFEEYVKNIRYINQGLDRNLDSLLGVTHYLGKDSNSFF